MLLPQEDSPCSGLQFDRFPSEKTEIVILGKISENLGENEIISKIMDKK